LANVTEVNAALAAAHRDEWARILAAVARYLGGDLARAEEATQEAYLAALRSWPEHGVPLRPAAWLTATARRRAVDLTRRDAALRQKLGILAATDAESAAPDVAEEVAGDEALPDDRLRLVFTCCHPALASEARAALTLRLVCGLTTAQIARAFLVPEPTMAARITRAKRKIAAAGVPYRVPPREELPERLGDVLGVVHLAFTAGHSAHHPDRLVDAVLLDRALDLARVLAVLLPRESEVLGLLALVELTDARRPARVDAVGNLIVLEEQDRSRWDADRISHGLAMLERADIQCAATGEPRGRYLLQAHLAAVHASAATWDETDWPAVVGWYDELLGRWPNPVVALNRAVAIGFAVGPADGLAALDTLDPQGALAGYHYLPAARADLLRRMRRDAEAAECYRAALRLCPDGPSGPEYRFLERRLADVD
jgi:RNA polymerase sigma-70 factor (ECF subfamily)